MNYTLGKGGASNHQNGLQVLADFLFSTRCSCTIENSDVEGELTCLETDVKGKSIWLGRHRGLCLARTWRDLLCCIKRLAVIVNVHQFRLTIAGCFQLRLILGRFLLIACSAGDCVVRCKMTS